MNAAPTGADTNRGPASKRNDFNCSGVVFSLGAAPDRDEALVGRYAFEIDDGFQQKLLPLRAVIVHTVEMINVALRDLKIDLPGSSVCRRTLARSRADLAGSETMVKRSQPDSMLPVFVAGIIGNPLAIG